MELHHRLRRDPSWHPSGCNICGQLGHQAAQCTVGTVNWRAMYGETAFTLRRAVFQSELDELKKSKQIDFAALEKQAKEYAQRQEGGARQAPPPQHQRQHAAAPPADAKATEEEERRKKAEDGLPEGWAVAFDAQKRPYFWHKTTKKVMWDKPNKDTPLN